MRRPGVTNTVQPQLDDPARDLRFRLGIERSGVGIWDFDLVSGEMIYSDRAKAIYGLAPDEPVTFDLIRDATHAEDLPMTITQFERAIDPAIRDRNSYEYRIVRPDGSICWALAHGEADARRQLELDLGWHDRSGRDRLRLVHRD